MATVLSHFQANALLAARRKFTASLSISLDLGLSHTPVQLLEDGVQLLADQRLTWAQVEQISAKEHSCFVVGREGIEPIRAFSEATNRYCSLYATKSAPTIVIAGFPMHRIKESDPYQDTLEKVKTLAPITGHVLDTSFGLGYTAIEAAKRASHVITIELDPAVIAIARQNPWSRPIFSHANIELRNGDSVEELASFADASFDRILHDPPILSLAGELYSAEFYRQLYRVLKPQGRLFHYIGNPDSSSGSRVTKGVMRRLQDVGFRTVREAARAFGVVANK